MKLYHYSAIELTEILTLDLQLVVTDERRAIMDRRHRQYKLPGPYYDHISFFHEKAPIENLGKYFPKTHKAWVKGNEVYEHEVDLRDIDLYAWEIVELPINKVVGLVDKLLPDNKIGEDIFFTYRAIQRRLRNESGTSVKSLERAISKLPDNVVRDAYKKLVASDGFKEKNHMYASTVPHLMIYTKSPVKVSTVTKRIVDTVAFENKPLSLDW